MTLDNILRYEKAAIAAMNVKEKPRIALDAITEFYTNIYNGKLEDPIILKALKDASEGVSQGFGITNIGVIQSAAVYADKYDQFLENTKVGDILNYFASGYKIPETVVKGLSDYKDDTLAELKDKNANKAIELMKFGRLKKISLATELKYSDNDITAGLLKIYPIEENEQKQNRRMAA